MFLLSAVNTLGVSGKETRGMNTDWGHFLVLEMILLTALRDGTN